jgi:biopolymer transport protein ExbB
MRRVEYLAVIGGIAPMLGLLGTVVGLTFAFHEVASTDGVARAADLADGIYHALVSTVGGLIVAIPAMAMYAAFRNRVDQLAAEAAYTALHALGPVKRILLATRNSAPPSPSSAGTR